ncbi:PIN domain-containing protein [Conexibacter stalactiti]|uniref:PIN domain-containing protein n=1 Tax=Conexibacter stalactiti TaxID=1940611 RepID=A0ABU4HWP9_9ACTN|nr:PIN domain-containing protein [Conexibacter stalactiti]MDW5597753.1 hypothetical protein [Conexibacter stalactiti]MEC5038395.1 PIN domain-containing protein [Conexibacter stalactiti]
MSTPEVRGRAVPAGVPRIAEIKARGGLSYPDAFCVATALRHRAPLYTGDPEIIKLGADIEVIDLRSTA